MQLKPEVKALLDAFANNPVPPLEQLSLEEARKGFEQSAKQMSRAEKLANTDDRKINGFNGEINIRIYTPEGTAESKLPAIVYYHGGGWVIGNIETHDALCHTLSNEAECIVVSVDYSLAPESKFPVAVEDSYLAVKWVFDNAEELNIDENFSQSQVTVQEGTLQLLSAILQSKGRLRRLLTKCCFTRLQGLSILHPTKNTAKATI